MKVSTLITGEIDCANLKTLLLAHKDKPAIINLNIGIQSSQYFFFWGKAKFVLLEIKRHKKCHRVHDIEATPHIKYTN
jgi:hypothetical protein